MLLSSALLIAGLFSYVTLARLTAHPMAPSALLPSCWFMASSIAALPISGGISYLSGSWSPLTTVAVFATGVSLYLPGLLASAMPSKIGSGELRFTRSYRLIFNAAAIASIGVILLRIQLYGLPSTPDFDIAGGADAKEELSSQVIPGLHYFEILTPFLTLAAIFELMFGGGRRSRARKIWLAGYVVYGFLGYGVLFSFSRGTLLIVLLGYIFLLASRGMRFSRILLGAGILIASLLGVTFLRFGNAGSEVISAFGEDFHLIALSAIYTYIAPNFQNLDQLVQSDLPPTFVVATFKFLLWPLFKGSYESGSMGLVEFNTLFFNARTFLYPFYHDLGLLGAIVFPTAISLVVTLVWNASIKRPRNLLFLASLQKAVVFTFFGNYFFGELVIVVPLLFMLLIAQGVRRPLSRRRHLMGTERVGDDGNVVSVGVRRSNGSR